MIRIRGPVGTLRVLMLPGESDPSWDSADAAAPCGQAEKLGAESEWMRLESTIETHRDQ